MRIVATSGYFNPLHKGHIDLLECAKNLGDKLIVIVNNDKQVALKGSKPFMDENERLKIIRSLACVDMAILSVDEDMTVCKTLAAIMPDLFAKGGDSVSDNVPEKDLCHSLGINIYWDVGGPKTQSSSWLKSQ